jgi:hypothetical protein
VFQKKSIQIKKEYLLLQILFKEWSKKTESTSLSKAEQDSKLQLMIKHILIQAQKSLQQKKHFPQMLSSKSECPNSMKKSIKNKSTLSNKVQLSYHSCNQLKINKLSKKLSKEELLHLPWIKSQEQPELKLLMLYHQWPTLLDIKQ